MEFIQLKNWKMSTKLMALCLAIGLLAVGSLGWLSVRKSSHALLNQAEQSFEAIRAARQSRVEDYFGFINKQMANFAQSTMIVESTEQFSNAFAILPTQIETSVEPQSSVYNSLNEFYQNEFGPRVKAAGQSFQSASHYIPASDAARLAQAMYIANNSNAVGSKHTLNTAKEPCDYNTVHAKFHPIIRDYLESFEYYDIFLFNLDGDLVYSVFKEADYATNFLNGPYAGTNFGSVYKQALNGSRGQLFVEDFAPYAPSYGAPASFIGSPVFKDGKRIGVTVFQMPVGKINSIMSDTAGMGESGETYLIGHDLLMRSDSRFSDESTLLINKIETETAKAAIGGATGVKIVPDYRGIDVISAYTPLDINGLDWALLAEIDLSEVLIPAKTLQGQILVISFGVALVIAFIAFLTGRALVKPIHAIVDRIKDIAQGEGDLTQRVDADRKDEIGELGQWFNVFVEKIHKIISDVTRVTQEVASAATEIAASSEEMSVGLMSQQEQTTQASAAVEEMSSSVSEVAQKSIDAANAAEQSGTEAAEGGSVVQQTIEHMKGIADQVNESAAAVSQLGEKSEQIGQIIGVINDIADQTNLLALNAAIEAARAGEHGRGFAVVADEVRKLAERTTTATEEVAKSIRDIQQDTKTAVERIEAGTERVGSGVELANNAGEALGRIVASSGSLQTMIQGIAAAAEEQSAASDQIARSMESINAVTLESSEGATQAAQAAAQLSEQSERLQNLVGQFKI